MKPVALIAALLLLAGCESDGPSDYSLYYQLIRQNFANGFGRSTHITRDQAAKVPYASIGYRLDDGDEQLLALATDTGGQQLWTSASHVVIVTRAGRIVRTVGLKQDVSAVIQQQNEQFINLAGVKGRSVTTVRLEDFPSIPVYGTPVTCTTVLRGSETIVILGRGISTKKIDETCQSEILNWSFIDSYWVDPKTSLVWRSIQHIAPKGGKVEVETLRPPG